MERPGHASGGTATTTVTITAAELRARCDELAETLHLVLACDERGAGRTWENSRLRAREVLLRYSSGQPAAESELLRVCQRVLFFAQRDPRQWHPETLEAFREMQEVLDGIS